MEEAFDHVPNGSIRRDFRPSIPIVVPRMRLPEILYDLDWIAWIDVLVPVLRFLQSQIHVEKGQSGHNERSHMQWQQQWHEQRQWKRKYLIFGTFFVSVCVGEVTMQSLSTPKHETEVKSPVLRQM